MRKTIITIVIGGTLVVSGMVFWRSNLSERFSVFSVECEVIREKRIVRGDSLEPLVKDSQKITVLKGYYQCNPIQRGDVVTFQFAGNKEPLIKIVQGIPGDALSLQSSPQGWNILLRGEILENSEEKPYLLIEQGRRMLSLYINDYEGTIPEHAYLLLGNLTQGSIDSTFFGLVDGHDILGKAIF